MPFMELDGPSKTIIVEPIEAPTQPAPEPLPAPEPIPVEPEKVPA